MTSLRSMPYLRRPTPWSRNALFLAPLVCIQAGCSPPSMAEAQEPPGISLQLLKTDPSLNELPYRAGMVLTWLDDRSVVLADADEAQLVVHPVPSGRPRRVGAKGAGPGEFAVPVSAHADGKGNLVVTDSRNSRISYFDRELRFKQSWPVAAMPLKLLSWKDDEVLGVWVSPGGGPLVKSIDLATGRSTEHFRPFTASPDLAAASAGVQGPNPFVPAAATPDGRVLIGGVSEYRIVGFDRRGIVKRTFGRPAVPAEYPSRAELERKLEAMDALLRAAGPAAAEHRDAARKVMEGRHEPFFTVGAFEVDSAGRLWAATQRGDGESTYVDMFGPDGAYQGTFKLRDRVQRMAIRLPLLAVQVQRQSGPNEGVDGVDIYRISTR